MYRSDIQIAPRRPEAGQPAVLRFTVRDGQGHPVPELAVAHEKPMHLVIVSTDLRSFSHVHPEAEGDHFRLEHTFEEGGTYDVIADYQEPGRGQVVDRHRLEVEGPALRRQETLAESARIQHADGLSLTLRTAGPLRAREGATLRFELRDAETDRLVEDLEPYLGARAHFMVLSADGEDFVHVHPLEETPSGSTVTAHAVFPRAGLYKLWAQLQRRGEVLTIPFVLRIGAASQDDTVPAGHGPHVH